MIKKIKSRIYLHFYKNRIIYLIYFITVIAAIIIGAIRGTSSSGGSLNIPEYMFNYPKINFFKESVIINFRTFFIIWLSGWSIWLYPLNFIELIAKCFGIGYSSAYLISAYSVKGLIVSLEALIIQNIILLPIIIIYSVIQFNFSVKYSKLKKSNSLYKQKNKMLKYNFAVSIIVFVAVFVCCLIEAYMPAGLIA